MLSERIIQEQTTKQKISMIISLAVPAMIENILQTVVFL